MKASKFVIAAAIFIYLRSSFAFEHECSALVRNERHNLVEASVLIKDLKSKDSFDGRFFKIVQGKERSPIRFNSDLSFRACHVYFHLSKARNFFIQKYQLAHLKKPRPLVVRLEMPLGFNSSTHFIHENHGKFYNNALTIPPSDHTRIDQVKPWGHEIWFAPKKKIKLKSSIQRAAEIASSRPVLGNMLLGIGQGQVTAIGAELLRGGEIGSLEREYYLNSLLFSVGITALVPNVIKWTSSLVKKTVFLDSAMIPEVIYHEFTHYALSPMLSLNKHSPVVEGVANFFAAVIGQTDAILKRSRKYARGLSKVDSKQSRKYDYFMEDGAYAQLDFAFKFLYALKKEFGEEVSTDLVFKSLPHLETLSLKEGMISALFKTLKDDPSKTYRLHRVAQQFGF